MRLVLNMRRSCVSVLHVGLTETHRVTSSCRPQPTWDSEQYAHQIWNFNPVLD